MTAAIDFELIDYRARSYVHGLRRAVVSPGHVLEGKMIVDTGGWHPRFRGHPWVISADLEGWGRDLRQHVVRVVKSRMMAGENPGEPETLMPDLETAQYWAAKAKRFAEADALRAANAKNKQNGRRRSTFQTMGDAARGIIGEVDDR